VNVLPEKHGAPDCEQHRAEKRVPFSIHQRADHEHEEEQEYEQVPREDRDQRNHHADREPEIAAERPALHA
jgi:hypothetical protein